jgi:kinesin family protein 2/24
MMGSTLTGIKAKNRNVEHEKNYGLYVLAARDIFEMASLPENSHLSVGASLFEIYGGKLFDLLNDRAPVKCLENHKGRVCFPGLSEHPITDALQLMGLIEHGSSNRSTGSTSANRDSSRSHAVLQLHLRKTVGRKSNVEHGRLTFIDLAGSERGADTNKASRTTRLEGADINTSLLALKEVIRALATGDSMTHIPFRGSKLTQVLKESFVGKNSRTVMVACVAPSMTNCEHTINTLRYADRVKERNPETGRLPDSIAAASSIETKHRPISFPNHTDKKANVSKDRNNEVEGDGDDTDDVDENWLSDLDNDEDDDDESDIFDNYDEGIDELNEVLRSPVATRLEGNNFFGKDIDDSPQKTRKITKKEAVAPLVSTHRSIMTEMLGMVKQEMTLVNCADADRELIDDYLDELEAIQDQQLSMISTLRESLVHYYAHRSADANDRSAPSDESFDNLLSPLKDLG